MFELLQPDCDSNLGITEDSLRTDECPVDSKRSSDSADRELCPRTYQPCFLPPVTAACSSVASVRVMSPVGLPGNSRRRASHAPTSSHSPMGRAGGTLRGGSRLATPYPDAGFTDQNVQWHHLDQYCTK